MTVQSEIYPGDEASPEQVLALAKEYHRAAESLRGQYKKRKPLTRAPFGLAAVHAIELYLNAFLLAHGVRSTELRGMQHDLSKRLTRAAEKGLVLKDRRAKHIEEISEAREYLVMRYGPELTGTGSPLNKLEATLNELERKVATQVANAK